MALLMCWNSNIFYFSCSFFFKDFINSVLVEIQRNVVDKQSPIFIPLLFITSLKLLLLDLFSLLFFLQQKLFNDKIINLHNYKKIIKPQLCFEFLLLIIRLVFGSKETRLFSSENRSLWRRSLKCHLLSWQFIYSQNCLVRLLIALINSLASFAFCW